MIASRAQKAKQHSHRAHFIPGDTPYNNFKLVKTSAKAKCSVKNGHRGQKYRLINKTTKEETIYCRSCYTKLQQQLKSLPKIDEPTKNRCGSHRTGRKNAVRNRTDGQIAAGGPNSPKTTEMQGGSVAPVLPSPGNIAASSNAGSP